MPFKVLVVGGAGGMGRWCVRLFRQMGLDVYISSRRDVAGLAKSLGAGVTAQEDAGGFDIVVLSVPIDAMETVASNVAPRMKQGALLMDLSSLKKAPVESMLRHAPPGVDVIGAHPLFGPDSDGRGRTVVLVPTERSNKWLQVIADLLEDAGYSVVKSTAESHDKDMAVVQALTHFMYVALGRTFENTHTDLGEIDSLKTPVYGITKEMAGRVLSQDPELYALIQSSEDAMAARHAFMDACRELSAKLDAGDMDGFKRDFTSAAQYYGDTEGARKRSERLIKKDIEDKLFVRGSVGLERAFTLNGRILYGVVRQAGQHDFSLETNEGTLTLKYEDVIPVRGEKLAALKSVMGPCISRDILVKLPIGADPSTLKWALNKIEGVRCVESETKDALDPDYIVYRFTISLHADRSEETLQRILRTIWGLGMEVK